MVQPLVFLGGQESIVQLGLACTRVFCESTVSASQAFPQHSGGSGHRALHVLQTQLHGYCSGELGEDQPPTHLPLLSCVPESIMSGEGSWEPPEGHWQQQNRMGSQALASSAQHRAGTACSWMAVPTLRPLLRIRLCAQSPLLSVGSETSQW